MTMFTGRGQNNFFCPPNEQIHNKYAIYFAISDNYSFAVANVIMGLYRHSAALMQKCDILVYHNGISDQNKKLLSSLHKNTIYMEMEFPESWDELLHHKMTVPWGPFIICKYFGFMLINSYEKVLFLDADMCIISDISEIFEIEEDMAWRNVLAWKASENFARILKDDRDYISAGNGGMIYFTDKLKKLHIGESDIVNAFEKIKDLTRGGNDERIIAWIAYDNKVTIKELDVKIWNTPVQRMTPETKLVHFLDYVKTSTKPWKNLASYLYFEEWAENYQRWIDMGGEGPINFTREDYYKLFSFEKLKKIEKQEKKIKSNKNEISELKSKYDAICNSNSYKITAPFRKIKKWIRKVVAILKR